MFSLINQTQVLYQTQLENCAKSKVLIGGKELVGQTR